VTDQEIIQRIKEIIWDWVIRQVEKENRERIKGKV